MSVGAMRAVLIEGMHDAEQLEEPSIKGNRSIEILAVIMTWSREFTSR